MAPALVDAQGFEQPAAQLRLQLFDSAGSRARQRHRAACPAIVAAGAAELANHLPQHLAGMGAALSGPNRKYELVLVDAGTDRPVDFLKADEEINHLGGQFRLGQFIHPAR